LKERVPDIRLNGHPTERLPNTLNVSFAGILAYELLEQIGKFVWLLDFAVDDYFRRQSQFIVGGQDYFLPPFFQLRQFYRPFADIQAESACV